jgi:ubiquinone/menaquinone biosynthesis C-methylase UbiE
MIKAFNSPFLPENPQLHSVRDGYDLWSELYDEEVNVLILLEERFLLPMIAGRIYSEILDCGCGTGRMTMWLKKNFASARVTGIDFSQGMLAKAQQKDSERNVAWQIADLNKTFPLADQSFDLITSTLVVEHIDNLAGYFAEIRRVARAGADIFITGLHPAMHLFGISARFKHPETKADIMPKSHCHDISTIVNHALAAGLKLVKIEEHYVDQQLIEEAPKAARYEGMPLLLILHLSKGQEK